MENWFWRGFNLCYTYFNLNKKKFKMLSSFSWKHVEKHRFNVLFIKKFFSFSLNIVFVFLLFLSLALLILISLMEEDLPSPSVPFFNLVSLVAFLFRFFLFYYFFFIFRFLTVFFLSNFGLTSSFLSLFLF